MAWLKRLFGRREEAEKGSVLVMGALSLVGVLGMAGLAVEGGSGYAAKVRNQRVADMAALGAAVAYQASSQSITKAQQTATDIAAANGLTSGNGTTVTAAQATVGTQSAIQVSVQTTVPIRLASLINKTGSPSYFVSNTAYASLAGSATTACIVALSTASGNGISASGGASVSANGCAINANATIASDNSSARIFGKQIVGQAISDAANTPNTPNTHAITTPPIDPNASVPTYDVRTRANAASDAIKSVSGVQTALCYVNKLTGGSDADYNGGNTSCTNQLAAPPTYTATGAADWNLDYKPRSAGGIYAYQDADYSCKYYPPGNTTYNIGTLNVGSCTIVFAAGTTLNVDTLTIGGGGTFTFGNGVLRVTNTLTLSGGVVVSIGNGSHSFGGISVAGGSRLIVGSGNLNITGKLADDGGGSVLSFNIGTGETVTIGNAYGAAISVSGGASLCFTGWNGATNGNACNASSATAGKFSANGSITSSGGSYIYFPKAAIHVVNGDLSLSSNADFGAGLYVIAGNWTNGTGGAMTGTDVTFALGGSFNFSGGTSFDLSAPSGNTFGVTDMLILTKTSAATSISAGSNGKAGGVIYAPKSAFSSSGGSAISSNGSACMMLIVSTITLTGSGTVNTQNCASQAAASTGTVALIQ